MLKKLLHTNIDHTDSLKILKGISTIYKVAIAVHIGFIVLFYFLNSQLMTIVNCISPFLYLLAFQLNKKNKILLGALIAITEVIVHGVLATLELGWSSGFHYYINLVFLFIIMLPNIQYVFKLLLMFFISSIYIYIYYLSNKMASEIIVSENLLFYMNLTNIMCTIFVLSVFIYIYTYAVNTVINRLKEREQTLENVNKQKDQLFSIVSHDLKNPFYAIDGLLKLLNGKYEKYTDEKRKLIIEQLAQGSSSIIKLLENLLKWARAQSGNISVNMVHVDIYVLVNEIIELFANQANKKSIALNNMVKQNTIIATDNEILSTILRNIISNAIKFTPEKGKVTISANLDHKTGSISITDTGIGINNNKLSKIFKLNENIQSLGTNDESGSGLGLIVSKEFAALLNAKITVNSTEGIGTTFTITFKN